jgi:hypothetical protein
MATGVGLGSTTLVRPHLGAKMLAREFRRTLPNLYLCAKTHFAKMDTPWAQPAAKVVAADMERGGSAAASDQLQTRIARRCAEPGWRAVVLDE